MPRVVEEELIGYGMQVGQGERQQRAPDGMPLFTGSGEPKTEPLWILVFTGTDERGRHVVKVPFDQAGRDALVEALTGGIKIVSQIPAI